MRLLRFLPAGNSKFLLVFLLFSCAALFAPSGRAEDLHYFKNYFVTGNYAVAGVGLYATGVNGWATGTIDMMSKVPAGADIVAAYLYWETVERTATPSSANGFFDFYTDSNGNQQPNPIVGDVVGNPNTPPCWSQGGTAGPGTWLRVYRADVLRYLNIDTVNTVNDVLYADGKHTVTLPDSGINQPGIVPHTEGASLVVVYRFLDGKQSYKAVVIFDGPFTMTKSSPAFSETISGFYDASGTGAMMTQIVGNGQPGFAATLTVNGNGPTGVSGTPFTGAQGPRWDNLTFDISNLLGANASQLKTQVTAGSNQTCLSWGAVITSTDVVNTDGDGNLDSWKTKGLHLNVGAPATSTTASIPATFGGCSDYPKEPCENLPEMGAVLGTKANPHKDIFVQIDWMQGSDGHIHAPKLAALQSIAGVFSKAPHNISVHFDVGNRYQQFATSVSNYMIVPAAYSEGGNVITESSLECPNSVVQLANCEYDSANLGYSVMGWKIGFDAVKNGFLLLSINQNFAHDRKDIFHYILFGHSLAGPFDPSTGQALLQTPWSVSGVGDLFGGDLMVTLGLWRTDNPPNCKQDDSTGLVLDANLCTDQTGTSLVQAGTLMHELGHNLGLKHAGSFDTPNCMANYPSIMNYLYQTRGLTGPMGDMTGVASGIEHIDYSMGTLLGLNENSLNGIPLLGSLPYRLRYFGPATTAEMNAAAKAHCDGSSPTGTPSVRLETPATLSLGTAIDWSNGTNPPIGVLVPGVLFSEDIDFDGTIGDSVAAGQGFIDNNDWAGLNLQQIGGRPNGGQLSGDVGPNDLSASDLGQKLFGQKLFGSAGDVLGAALYGQKLFGQKLFGQKLFGQKLFGQKLFGEVDYDTAISTLDATGASTPLVAAQSASSGTVYNQVTLTWGLPSLGQIRTYTIYRTNLQAVIQDTVVAGSVSGAPPTTAFNDPVTDPNLSDIGANCPSGNVCYDTNYQYYVVASTNSNSSTPSNFATVTVDHLYVTAYTGSVMYGNPLPNSMAATISGLPLGGITSANFTCPTPAPRNVGSYPDTCTGPAAVPLATPTVGVTYIAGILMITPRPLYIDAVTNSKLYDSTTTASAVPVVEAAVTNVSGLAYTDTVTGQVEAYLSPNVLGVNLSTVSVTTYTVNDGNNSNNYTVTTKTATGTITARPLYIDAVTNAKLYDSTTTAGAVPVVEATVASVSGLVGSDSVTGPVEAYASPNVLGVNLSTLAVTIYTVNDGNSGRNYTVNATKTAIGTVTARPLYIDAVTYTKLYDSTATTGALPLVEGTVAGVSGLVGTNTVTGLVETYLSPNVLGVNGSTLVVALYIVNDGNSGSNYSVTTKIALGTITQRPLTIDAQPNTKTFDGTTAAATAPTVEAATLTTGLVGNDNVTGLGETYDTPNAGTGKTMSVSAYTINDHNNGGNYAANTATNTSGEIDTLYTSDATLSDFTSPITNWASFNSASSSDMTLPYTPTAAILDTGDRVVGSNTQAIVVQFSAPVSRIRVLPNIDQYGSSFDGFQYTISGSNDGVTWTSLFDATSVIGSGEPFTLGTFTGTEPNVVNNVLTNTGSTGVGTGGVGPGGTVGYVTDFVFSQAYTYYSFGPSTMATTSGNTDQELSGVAALP